MSLGVAFVSHSPTKQRRLHFAGAERDGARKRITHFLFWVDGQGVQQAGGEVLRRDGGLRNKDEGDIIKCI
jgi:hypothetical protein